MNGISLISCERLLRRPVAHWPTSSSRGAVGVDEIWLVQMLGVWLFDTTVKYVHLRRAWCGTTLSFDKMFHVAICWEVKQYSIFYAICFRRIFVVDKTEEWMPVWYRLVKTETEPVNRNSRKSVRWSAVPVALFFSLFRYSSLFYLTNN